jgi:hypothetical protein
MRTPHAVIVARAAAFRAAPTTTEALLWEALRAEKLGVRFRRQVVLGRYIADFVAPRAKLVVEVDGEVHGRGARGGRAAGPGPWSHGLPGAAAAARAGAGAARGGCGVGGRGARADRGGVSTPPRKSLGRRGVEPRTSPGRRRPCRHSQQQLLGQSLGHVLDALKFLDRRGTYLLVRQALLVSGLGAARDRRHEFT